MKTKELDPKNLGQREDWFGNNASFECPVCGKVYVVSGFIKHERPCPNCGESRGSVTGSYSEGGKAVVVWDDRPAFCFGKRYSRKEIKNVLGGSEIEYLPTEKKRVVCGCFTLEHNPEAPDIIIPGNGPIIKREAKQFCTQNYPVPIFIKRRPNLWEYVGNYKVERFSTDPAEIAAHHKNSVTPLAEVTRVSFLKTAANIA